MNIPSFENYQKILETIERLAGLGKIKRCVIVFSTDEREYNVLTDAPNAQMAAAFCDLALADDGFVEETVVRPAQ